MHEAVDNFPFFGIIRLNYVKFVMLTFDIFSCLFRSRCSVSHVQ